MHWHAFARELGRLIGVDQWHMRAEISMLVAAIVVVIDIVTSLDRGQVQTGHCGRS
ncbi:hypothetical protein D3C85_1768660 [compost metagenome]